MDGKLIYLMFNKIPKKIHLTFLNKEEVFPKIFDSCLERIRTFHPDWEVILYSEIDAMEILSCYFPQLTSIYNSYNHVVQKSDLLRILLVYLFGGFYMDLDMFCLKKLDELRGLELILGEEKTISEEELSYYGLEHKLRIANYMFGGIPKHKFWLLVLNEIILKCNKPILTENDILESTGPGLLTNVYHAYKDSYKGITLLKNIDRKCLIQGHDAISCHFGNFAAHLHQGTWRWGNERHVKEQKYSYAKNIQDMNPIIFQTSDEFSFDNQHICLLEDEFKKLKHLNNLNEIYLSFKSHFKTISTCESTIKCKVLMFGNPIDYISKLDKNNRNVLYTTTSNIFSNPDSIISINEYYNYFIVPHHSIKEKLLDTGVSIPIEVIALGFYRHIRDFDSDKGCSGFTISFLVSQYSEDLEKVYCACEKIQRQYIPELRLKLIWPIGTLTKSSFNIQYLESSSWIQNIEYPNTESNIFDCVDCHLSIRIEDFSCLGPMESLYLGIPTIISDNLSYDNLISSGYFEVIDPQYSSCEDFIPSTIFIENSIMKVYQNYSHYNQLAIDGSRWIEDLHMPEFTVKAIMDFMKKID